jgi:putative endonuclease
LNETGLPTAAHLAMGRAAEDAACRYLERAGYRIVTRNFRHRLGELDVVAIEDGVLALVEVRFRSGSKFGGAAASVTHSKRRRLQRAAEVLLKRHPELAALPARFDFIEVGGTTACLECRLIRAAFSL